MRVIHSLLAAAAAAAILAMPTSAQSTRDRVRDACLEQADATTCDAAIELLWPILVDLSTERGKEVLRQPGQGTMTTPAFQSTSPTLRVAWTMDALDEAGCGIALQLVPLTPGAEPFDILSTAIPGGVSTSGTGWLYQVPIDQYAVHQSGPGSCPWTVTITAE